MFLRILILFIFVVVWCKPFAQTQLLSLEGTYQDKNLLVNNPPMPDGFGFCISKVLVNGEILPAVIQTSHFEIDFKLFHLRKGEQVFVVLEHASGCEPRFINPEVLLPKSTFECSQIKAQKDGLLTWTTTNENASLDYTIEQYKWGRWVEVGQVKGKGQKGANNYIFQLSPHSGKNIVRVSQTDNSGKARVSPSTSFVSNATAVSFSPAKVHQNLYFKTNGKAVKTKFEIYDAYGNLLKTGFNNVVDCTNFVSGVYFINYDNKSEKFIKIDVP
ncbi:MAG: hypothetical protein RLZZ38_422 [Bacteroidota bacterium]|jgi:hypothetical protein